MTGKQSVSACGWTTRSRAPEESSALAAALADGVQEGSVLETGSGEGSLHGYEENTGIRAERTGTDGFRQTVMDWWVCGEDRCTTWAHNS